MNTRFDTHENNYIYVFQQCPSWLILEIEYFVNVMSANVNNLICWLY